MRSQVDYGAIASSFDRRYERNDYEGVRQTVLSFVGQMQGRFLEVGCGTGHWLQAVMSHAERIAGVDPSRPMLERARSNAPHATLVQARAEALPFGSATVDRMICINALHHFTDRTAFFREARRLVRSGGGLLVVGLDPHAGRDRWWIYEYFDEVLDADRQRYPSAEVVRDLMAQAGFTRCVTQEVQRFSYEQPLRAAHARGMIDRTSASQLMVIGTAAYEHGVTRLQQAQDAFGDDELMLCADLRLYGTIGWLADPGK